MLVICHGGPISEPPDAKYIIEHCRGVDGFYGASSVERLPAERAIAEQIRTFKGIRLPEGEQVCTCAEAGDGGKARRPMSALSADAVKALRFVTSANARVEFAPWGKHWWLSQPGLTDTKQLTLVRVRMKPGAGHQFHYHPAREEIIYIVDGVAEQWVDREKRRLKAGEIAFIPKSVVHAIHNPSKKPMTFLAILSPARGKGAVPRRRLRTTNRGAACAGRRRTEPVDPATGRRLAAGRTPARRPRAR